MATLKPNAVRTQRRVFSIIGVVSQLVFMNRYRVPFGSVLVRCLGLAYLTAPTFFPKPSSAQTRDNAPTQILPKPPKLAITPVFQEQSVAPARLAFARDTLYEVTEQGKVKLIQFASNTSVPTVKQISASLPVENPWVVSPRGDFLATTRFQPYGKNQERERCLVTVYRLPQLTIRNTWVFSSDSTPCFSPGGTTLYILNSFVDPLTPMGVIDLRTGQQKKILTTISSGTLAAVSPDGNLLACQTTGEGENGIQLLDLKTKHTRTGGELDVFTMAPVPDKSVPAPLFISPQNDFIWTGNAAVSLNKNLKLGKSFFHLSSEQERALWLDSKGRLLSINFEKKVFRLWNVRQKRLEAESLPVDVQLEEREDYPPRPRTLSAVAPDGRYVAIAQGGKVQVWKIDLR